MIRADEFLQRGIDTMKQRAASRDCAETGERAMGSTVGMFNILYSEHLKKGLPLTEEQGWIFMVLLKLSRSSQGAFNPDDYVDLPAYAGLAGEAASRSAAVLPVTVSVEDFLAQAGVPELTDEAIVREMNIGAQVR